MRLVYCTTLRDGMTGKEYQVTTVRIGYMQYRTELTGLSFWPDGRHESLFSEKTDGDMLAAVETHSDMCNTASRLGLP